MTTNESSEVAVAEELFLSELHTIERAIRFACHDGAVRDADAEDFASYVKLKLIEDDYAVIRKFERRGGFPSFISIVIQRLLLDYRIAQWGKWHSSAQARNLGEMAITLEAMLYRDGRTIEETLPFLQRRWPSLTKEAVEKIARALPPRMRRPRAVELELALDAVGIEAEHVIDGAFADDRLALSRRIAMIVRQTLRELSEEDRLIFRLRYEGGMSIADVSRMLNVPQKPLYRRLQRCLLAFRRQLEAAGIDSDDVEEVLKSSHADLDFGFDLALTDGPSRDEENA